MNVSLKNLRMSWIEETVAVGCGLHMIQVRENRFLTDSKASCQNSPS